MRIANLGKASAAVCPARWQDLYQGLAQMREHIGAFHCQSGSEIDIEYYWGFLGKFGNMQLETIHPQKEVGQFQSYL